MTTPLQITLVAAIAWLFAPWEAWVLLNSIVSLLMGGQPEDSEERVRRLRAVTKTLRRTALFAWIGFMALWALSPR